MRNTLFAAVVAGSLAVPALAVSDPAPEGQLQTRDEQTRASAPDAASSPMYDLNVMRAKIPPVLLAAMADPYARPAPANCQGIIAKVKDLTVALGDDLDMPEDDPERTTTQKAGGLGKDLVRAGAESLLPLRGFVRRLSGAEQHDRLVQQAIIAGHTRRAYLKGLGESRGCAPPGTPRHQVVVAQPVADTGKPQYPTR
jgi:hypothetical protein